MKKMIFAAVLASLLMCAGCSVEENSIITSTASNADNFGERSDEGKSVSDKTDDPSFNSSAKSSDEASTESSEETSAKASLSDMLPDAASIFEDASFNTVSDGEKMYCFMVEGYKDGEYEKYVEECKKIFTDVKFDSYTDSNNKFEARTEDGKYYVSVQLIFDQNSFTVTCGARNV